MTGTFAALTGFLSLFILLALRIPVGIAMVLVGTVGFGYMVSFQAAFNILTISPASTLTNEGFVLVTFFILMGELANRSGLSSELFRACNAWFGHRRGGLAMATIGASGGFAAICGSSVATAATMTRVALPEMRKYGYSDALASGSIAAGGTLGILIPPSIVLAIYGILTEQDIQKLFLAGVVPGILAIAFYMIAVRVAVYINADSAQPAEPAGWSERWRSLANITPIALIFIGVIGGMFAGVFTPSEAASMGAFLTFVVGMARREINLRIALEAAWRAVATSASVFTILIGSYVFSYFLAVTQAPQNAVETIGNLPLSPMLILLVILLGYLILGCFLDTLAMLVLTLPITFPLAVQLGFDPIWFGIVIVMTIELGLITPPIGMNVFVIQASASDIPIGTIFRGVVPFIFADVLRLAMLVAIPAIALYLPAMLE